MRGQHMKDVHDLGTLCTSIQNLESEREKMVTIDVTREIGE